MHSTVLRFIGALGTDAQQRRYFDEVTGRGRLFGSWGSEPAVSLSRTFLMETVIREDGPGYVVDGVKYFCTMALGASHYMVWCALDGGTDMSKSLVLALVPADAPGIATDGKWNTLGMRATYSPSVTFTGVRVDREAVLGHEMGHIKHHHMIYYLGFLMVSLMVVAGLWDSLVSLPDMQVWLGIGFNMVVYLAGLQAIPAELYEAALVDGASSWQRFRRITLPLIAPTTFFLLVFQTILGMQAFDQIFVMTSGGPPGPGGATTTVTYYIYREAFHVFDFGIAAAAGTVLFVIIFVLTALSRVTVGRGETT